jgi:ribosomal-protein-serine acetyltransferase
MELIVDENIILKQIELKHAPDIFNIMDSEREYLGKWLPFVEYTKEVKDTENYINSLVNAPADLFEYVFVIEYKDEVVGLSGFRSTDRQNKKTEIGYWLSEKYQHRGIVTKSVTKLCDFAYNDLEMNRIQIKCAIGNTPSEKIPERLSFRYEGIERDGELLSDNTYANLSVYSKLKND